MKICPDCHLPIPSRAPGGYCPACLLAHAEDPPATGRHAPPIEEIAAAFPQLTIISLIGQGGMGFVYQADQPALDRTVALKILAPDLGRDPEFEERFAREARVLGKLQHPNIVSVFEHGESGGFFYLMMEYIDGVNLRQAMEAGRFTPEQALAIVPGICDALQTAHARGICHRDIKPENILLDREGRVKIVDFGIARIVGEQAWNFTLTRTGGALGSAAYMAPEQHEKPHDVDHRADIYSLGVVLYELLTGELPLGRFPEPSRRADVSQRIDEIVLRTLEKERELRQQSADDVKTEVGKITKVRRQYSARRYDIPSLFALGFMVAGTLGFVANLLLPAFCAILLLIALIGGFVGWRSVAGKCAVVLSTLLILSGTLLYVTPIRHPREEAKIAYRETQRKLGSSALPLILEWKVEMAEMHEPGKNYGFAPDQNNVLPAPENDTPFLFGFGSSRLDQGPRDMALQLAKRSNDYGLAPETPDSGSILLSRFDWMTIQEIQALSLAPGELGTFSTLTFPLEENYDNTTPAQVIEKVRKGVGETDSVTRLRKEFFTQNFSALPPSPSKSWVFIAGRRPSVVIGILQVSGTGPDGKGTKIRYKILKRLPGTPEKTNITWPIDPAELSKPLEIDESSHWYPWAEYIKDGDMRRMRGDINGALNSYQVSLRAAKYRPNISESHSRIGDIFCIQGKLPEALKSYQESTSALSTVDLDAPEFQDSRPALAKEYVKLGDVQHALSDAKGARRSYLSALRISESLRLSWETDYPLTGGGRKLARNYTPEEVMRRINSPKQNENAWHLMWLICQAAALKDEQLEPLLQRKELFSQPELALALAAYDYSVNSNSSGLDYILSKLSAQDVGADANETVVLSFINEWDRTIAAVNSHFTATDGSGGDNKNAFWATRKYLFPRSYLKYRGIVSEGAPIPRNLQPGGSFDAPPYPLEPIKDTPQQALIAMIEAARWNDADALRVRLSSDFQKILTKGTGDFSNHFKELALLRIEEVKLTDDTHATATMESSGPLSTEVRNRFQLALEDNVWKITQKDE